MDSLYTLITSLIAFIIALTILVAVHEFGHFWVARKFNVKVLRFSIGFGKPLFRFARQQDETEYVVAALPLGGYVKMLDEREGVVSEEEKHRAFNQQSVYKRFGIVFAGPFINFIFAIFAFYCMLVLGVEGVKPILGKLDTESMLYQAGLRQGDEIQAIEGVETPTWEIVRSELLMRFVDRESEVHIKVLEGDTHTIDFSLIDPTIKALKMPQVIGLKLNTPVISTVIGQVVADMPAAQAGLLAGDKIIAIDDHLVQDWQSLVTLIQTLTNKEAIFTIVRAGTIKKIPLIPQIQVNNGKMTAKVGIIPKIPALPPEMLTTHQYNMLAALPAAIDKTWDMSLFTLKMMKKMIKGEESLKNISGPLTIAQYAGYSAQLGIERFLFFLALVSLSLGIINLLPIPMLDGGHLLYYLVEMIKGSPVSERTEEWGMKIGGVVLFSLMALALFNDFERLLG